MFWVSFSRGKARGSYSRSQEERRQLVQNWPNVTLQMKAGIYALRMSESSIQKLDFPLYAVAIEIA